MVEKKKLIIKIAPGIHFDLDMIECDHLNMIKSIKNPAQSWKIHSVFLEEDCPDQLVGESSSVVFSPELHEVLDAPHVHSEMLSCDRVVFQLKNPQLSESSDLSWPDIKVLAVGVDGDRKDSSIGHSSKMRKRQKHISHIPLMRSPLVVLRTAKNEKIVKKMKKSCQFCGLQKIRTVRKKDEHDFRKKNIGEKRKKLTCSRFELAEVHEVQKKETSLVVLESIFWPCELEPDSNHGGSRRCRAFCEFEKKTNSKIRYTK